MPCYNVADAAADVDSFREDVLLGVCCHPHGCGSFDRSKGAEESPNGSRRGGECSRARHDGVMARSIFMASGFPGDKPLFPIPTML